MDVYESDGLRFDVLDDGPAGGEPVVLLHGFPETSASWAGVIPSLVAAGYRVLTPDQRGYSPGARPRGRRAYTLDKLAGDVVGLLDAAGLSRAHVVGHDWGGIVAWELADRHADRLASVASLTTPHPAAFLRAYASSSQVLKSWYMLAFQVPFVPEWVLSRPVGRRFFTSMLTGSGLSAEHAREMLDRMDGALTGGINWYRALPLNRPGQVTRPIQVPAMYVYATGDRYLGRKAADDTARYVTGPYRYEVLEGLSHWLPEENPQVVADLVLAHLATYPAG